MQKYANVYVHTLRIFCESLKMWLGGLENKSGCAQGWGMRKNLND